MSTQPEIAVYYDVSNDFFRLWLDKRMIQIALRRVDEYYSIYLL